MGDLRCYQRRFNAMGSPCDLKIYAASKSRGQHMLQRMVNEIERLESRYSRYRSDSLLSKINQVADLGGEIEVDEETAGLLTYLETCFKESHGLFDATSGILREAWSFKDQSLPSDQVIASLLDRVGWEKLSWQAPLLRFHKPRMALDLGGAVKEYAVDRLTGLCWHAEIFHGLINLGGDIGIIGPHPDGAPWTIGLTHPRRPGEFIATLRLMKGALASSGDYERCIEVDGIRYGHILNPKTGWPVRHLAAVSVLADLCVVAGSASTIAMLKEADGPDWLQNLGVAHMWVDVDGTSGGSLVPG